MKTAKKILQHNVNNLRQSVSMNYDLYDKGINTRTHFFKALLKCFKDRFKLFHWLPSSFLIIATYFLL
ncbi:MAG: hypothetical protein CMD96_08240 [Gammaproteobacteria bacterium]|jgi:hypothetical protein|nr:hypothetical protein [Gammaproteobacteria bacterium]HJP19416.1 hypothetical protein [Nitrospinota bacterium]